MTKETLVYEIYDAKNQPSAIHSLISKGWDIWIWKASEERGDFPKEPIDTLQASALPTPQAVQEYLEHLKETYNLVWLGDWIA